MTGRIVTAARASALIYSLANSRKDGHWLLPANVCPAVPLALMQAGATFDFIDLNPHSLCMDVERAAAKITDTTAGVIYVHSYGFAPDAEADLRTLRTALPDGALLVDDRALCVPKTDIDAHLAHGVDAVIYSTGHGKVLDLGGGGYGIFAKGLAYHAPPKLDPAEAEKADSDLTRRYKAAMAKGQIFDSDTRALLAPWIDSSAGPNWPELQLRISRNLPKALAHKRQLNAIYRDGLQGLKGVISLSDPAHDWRYNVRAKTRDKFLELLFREGLFASAHYYPSPALFGGAPCPVAEGLGDDILNLFNDVNFTKTQAKHVVSLARDFYSRA